jgi:hypothetical protein
MMTPDAGRRLRLILAAIWLADAALQYQPFMFTKAFGRMLAESAPGNPPAIADPITWSAGVIGHHPVAANAAFATIQLLLAIGIAWRPAVKFALAASMVWSVAVWWLGEGLGGVLAGSATPWNGAPGAVIIYALLAVLLWPADRDASASFVAGRPLGRLPARLLWLALWGSMAYFALQAASTAPQGLHDMLSAMASGEPGWIASIDHGAAALLAGHGAQTSAVLAIAFEIVAMGIFLSAPFARVAVILAVAAAAVIWVIGENFGAIFTGSATDPNSGLLLGLLAVAYWPARAPAGAWNHSDLGSGEESSGGLPCLASAGEAPAVDDAVSAEAATATASSSASASVSASTEASGLRWMRTNQIAPIRASAEAM